MSELNLFMYPAWRKSDAAAWKKVLSVLVTRQVISPTGEGEEAGELWFAPGKRSAHLLKGGVDPAFEDCRIHNGNPYFIPDGDTGEFGCPCPACHTALEDVLTAEAIVDFNEADDEDDRQKCPKCKAVLDVEKLTCRIPTALAPSFLCFIAAAAPDPNPELVKALEEASGCSWKWLTEKVEL